MNRRMEQFEIEESPLDPNGVYDGRRKNQGKVRTVATEARVMRIFVGILSAIVLIIVVTLLITNTGHHTNRDASAAAHTGTAFDSGFNMQHNWGSYSPYFDTGKPFEGIVRRSPYGEHVRAQTCKLQQVHVLHRHGDRFPTSGVAKRMRKVAFKLHNMTDVTLSSGGSLPENLAWLAHWQYLLGEDVLVGAGRGALFDSGAKFWGSHGRLLYPEADGSTASSVTWSPHLNLWPNGTERPRPVLRGTTQARIEHSMRTWAAGFFGIRAELGKWYDAVLMPEDWMYNNSLAPYYACPNNERKHAHSDKPRAHEWINTYLADATTRIQKMLPLYDSLTPEEVNELQNLCVFETAAYGSSGFCGWFTEQEWRGYEYLADLKFYGDSAYGSATAPAMGLPWLTELRARLNKQLLPDPINGVNTTLDGNEATFPLHQPFYADFTHDSVIVSVLAALQFPFTKSDLSPHKIKLPRQFIISRLTPFAARLYVELLECGEGGNTEEYVRLKLNDRVLPLRDLKYCEDADDGLCTRKSFLKLLDWALKALDYDDICFTEREYKPYEP